MLSTSLPSVFAMLANRHAGETPALPGMRGKAQDFMNRA
jgi:hypothetical protein